MDDIERKYLDEIVLLMKRMIESQDKLFRLMSKYDDSYLAEVEKDGYAREG